MVRDLDSLVKYISVGNCYVTIFSDSSHLFKVSSVTYLLEMAIMIREKIFKDAGFQNAFSG